MSGGKIKIGILLDSFEVAAWVYHSMGKVAKSEGAEIAVIILNRENPGSQRRPGEIWEDKGKIVNSLYSRIDQAFFHREPDAFRLLNALELVPTVPTIEVESNQERNSVSFKLPDIEHIKSFGLDVLVYFGSSRLHGNILDTAKFGIWSYHHGHRIGNQGGPGGFWEVLHNETETEVILHRLSESSEIGDILYRSSFSTFPFSPSRNRNFCFWGSSPFLSRQIQRLYSLGDVAFFAELRKFRRRHAESHPFIKEQNASNLSAFLRVANLITNISRELFRRIFYLNTWYLLFDLNGKPPTSFYEFREIVPPKDRFWADPNTLKVGDHYYIFLEEYFYAKRKGHISVMEMDKQGNFKRPVPVLEKNYHLSYPFVFPWQGKYYMVPESAQNKTIDLYECVEFPYKWEFRMNLMRDVLAVDTTLLYHNEKWWMFTAMADNEGSFPQVELYLFFSEELLTERWDPHPLNPIVSDVKRARPAGPLSVKNETIIRPSQDCSKMYGYGFDLNEVTVLSESEYEERTLASIRPHGRERIQGTHSFTEAGGLTMIDVFTRRMRFL
jgi:hypothetical protein